MGSPPRMRGKAPVGGSVEVPGGITPAYAGKRPTIPRGESFRSDHPRMCGEKSPLKSPLAMPSGSPPRVRGKVSFFLSMLSPQRITPAHAGKSRRCSSSHWTSRDHPRACGEKTGNDKLSPPSLGSPPRMRGKAHRSMSLCLWSRITPACAGKRLCFNLNIPTRRDHPRACGEKLTLLPTDRCEVGSPPRMRGKGTLSVAKGGEPGITPAHAGKRYLLLVRS